MLFILKKNERSWWKLR